MPQLSTVDHRANPPRITIPRDYNAAHDLIERNLKRGRADKIAFIDDNGQYSYGEVADRTARFANVLKTLGLEMEHRILLCLHDSIDFPTAFLGAIRAGIVPIPVNTLLTSKDYEYMVSDSRARIAVISAPLLPLFQPLLGKLPHLKHILVSGEAEGAPGVDSLTALLAEASATFTTVSTTADDVCFWLYSSGSTGAPKGTVHLHSSPIQTSYLYAQPILGIEESDVGFSAAKLFFAYGLGNGLTFPMSVGATSILMAERPTPESVFARLRRHQPTIFFGVPTLYASMLASPDLPKRSELRLRRCTSAGEALPYEIGNRWSGHMGVEIFDGLGSTEMLHIFLSNRSGDIRYGTTGKPVPGYQVRLMDDHNNPVAPGEVGELQVAGATSAALYWNNREKSRNTFQGTWTRSGDKYYMDNDGYYTYAGRSDDMLKVSGIYVSPIEVEATLFAHDAVLEAAVVGKADDDGLIKPIAYVVTKPGHAPSPALADELKRHVKAHLAPYKYPRWIEFINELPKTATGKIQRFKLRTLSSE
ncbi:MAG: benzoate-CoA ligase family protein [Gammaproteobacteria bacterium]|nr:benzoate-CoA ligase family protein [Gammaproteobacteria bacterium]MCP5458393.1 benzoate-CoA ligase family protein [Gammaproteobacteria bacterium]